MRPTSLLIAAMIAVAPLAAAHTFNHEDRHEACQVYGAPQGHFVGDGHAHTHDPVAGAALHDHDPCKQVRMKYPDYENKAPLSEIDPPAVEINPVELLFSDGDPTDTEVFVGGEAYSFPVPEGSFHKQNNLVVLSDLQAAGMGFPGSGTYADPYVVEGYLITGNMVFKDTSKCFVIRNNVVVNRAAVGPLVPDPGNVVHLPDLNPYWQQVLDTANALRQEYLDLKAQWDALKQAWDAEKADRDALKAQWDAWKAEKDAEAQWWQDQFDQFELDYVAAVERVEAYADEFEAYASQYQQTVEQPDRLHSQYVDYVNDQVLDMDALQPAFESYQQQVIDWIYANPPPQDPPQGWPGSAAAWQAERENYQSLQAEMEEAINDYWTVLMANAPDEAAYQQFLAEYAAFLADYDAFIAEYEAFLAEHSAFVADYEAFQDEFDQVWEQTGQQIAAAQAHFNKVATWTFEYVGALGSKLYNTLDELLQWVLNKLFGILNPLDPNNVAANTGQLVLDWNGQCVHAYNNVVNDLRVNQNNDRTGFATGGIVEDNRFFTIGQIRHYDGIFRQNEVGNRAHLHALLNPAVVPAPASVRSVNNDGADQGWYLDNVIYGQIDLDFHGHHHSAGFFAPLSHYHGSTYNTAYMRTGTACTATYGTPDRSKASGPWVDYPQDNDVEVLGDTVLAQADPPLNCLPHWDHGKRWTSVYFNDNVVIDPNGVGLRFEDRDHRADDEQANSENMRELKMPHFHQKWVQLEGNAVVGKIFVDVLNAKGTDLWTDTWAAVASPAGAGRTVEALSHPGASIVNSHPYRNDAWLDIQRNSLFQTQSTGVLVADAEDLTLLQLKDNRAFGLRSGFQSGKTPAQFLDWLRASEGRTVDAVHADIAGWGGADRGVQAFATLSNLRDAFTVEHCGNAARGLDRGLVALDRIYDDGQSIVRSCGTNSWGSGNSGVELAYTPWPPAPERCTASLREDTGETDDFYVSELAFDALDGALTAQQCEPIPDLASQVALPKAGLP